ncbi:MAG: carboxypeptidase-like regulatory domain-containing protein [Bacteroidales bacterium]
MNKIKFITLLLVLISPVAAAQINLSGTVYDANSWQPVPFATVALDGYPTGTCTNKSGHFWLTLPKGAEGDLIISSLGYQPLNLRLPKRDTVLSIPLTSRAYSLEAVTISGKSQSAKRVLKKAIKNIPSFYKNEPSNSEKELTVLHKNGEETLLSASTKLTLEEPGYKDGPVYSIYDSRVEKIINVTDKIPSVSDKALGLKIIRLFNVLTTPMDILKVNPARYEHWSIKNYNEYDYRFSNDTVINKHTCYVIEATPRDSLTRGIKYLDKDYFFISKQKEVLMHYKSIRYIFNKADPRNSYEMLDKYTVSFTQRKEGFIADKYRFEGYIRQERSQGQTLIISSFVMLE